MHARGRALITLQSRRQSVCRSRLRDVLVTCTFSCTIARQVCTRRIEFSAECSNLTPLCSPLHRIGSHPRQAGLGRQVHEDTHIRWWRRVWRGSQRGGTRTGLAIGLSTGGRLPGHGLRKRFVNRTTLGPTARIGMWRGAGGSSTRAPVRPCRGLSSDGKLRVEPHRAGR